MNFPWLNAYVQIFTWTDFNLAIYCTTNSDSWRANVIHSYIIQNKKYNGICILHNLALQSIRWSTIPHMFIALRDMCCDGHWHWEHTRWPVLLCGVGMYFRYKRIWSDLFITLWFPHQYSQKVLACEGELLTHWDGVTHICVSKSTIIGWDNGLSPVGAKPFSEQMREYC